MCHLDKTLTHNKAILNIYYINVYYLLTIYKLEINLAAICEVA